MMINKNNFLTDISKIERKNDGSYIIIKNNVPYHIPDNDEYKQEYNMITEYITENNLSVNDYIENTNHFINCNSETYIRSVRDSLLNEADIMLLKYQEQVALGIIEENSDYYLTLLKYKQDLRDIPEQEGFPENVIFPKL